MTRARLPRPHEIVAARSDPRLRRAFVERGYDTAWRTRGLCRTADPEVFFPAANEPADAALRLCAGCGVQGACLAWALDVGDGNGVWGGTTPRERRAMLVTWRAEPIERVARIEQIDQGSQIDQKETLINKPRSANVSAPDVEEIPAGLVSV